MKKFALFLLFAISCPLMAQTAPCTVFGTFSSATTSAVFDNRKLGCYQWRVVYSSTGFSVISIQLEEAPDNSGVPGSWSAFTGSTVVTDGSNPSTSTSGATIGVHSQASWLRLNLVTATGSGAMSYQVWGANSTSNIASLGGGGITTVTATAPITSSGGTAPNISATYQGNGAKIQASTGTTTSGDCVEFDANGNTVDAGLACGASVTIPASATVLGTNSSSQFIIQTGTIANNTTGNAATSTALALAGSDCSAGQAPRGVDASGNALNCTSYLTVNQGITLTGDTTGGPGTTSISTTTSKINGTSVPASALAIGTNGSSQPQASSLQGTDSKLLTAGTVTGTGASLCTDASGGATTSGCSSGTTFQVNGTGLTSSSTVNFENSAATNGQTFSFTNPSAGNVQLGVSGTLNNAGLTNSAITMDGVSTSLGGTFNDSAWGLTLNSNLVGGGSVAGPISTGIFYGTSPYSFTALTPTATTTSTAGNSINYAASNAVAGTSSAGAAAGGNVSLTAGNAARFTSGNANGGNVVLNTGAGIGTGIPGYIQIDYGGTTTQMGIGASSTGTLDFYNGTSDVFNFGTLGNFRIVNGGYIGFVSSSSNSNTAADTFILRTGVATLQHGAADVNGSPVAQIVRVQSASGVSNTAGANWTLQGSAGTGTGAGGSIIFQTSPASTSGTTKNSYTTALTIDSNQNSTFTNQVTLAGSPATVGAGQLSISGTTTGNTNCGGVTVGATGCIEINVAGTQRYVPYF